MKDTNINNDGFEQVGESVWQTKETFTHKDTVPGNDAKEFKFDYKFLIQATDFTNEYEAEDSVSESPISITTYLVMSSKSLSPERQEEIERCCGGSDFEDMVYYGAAVTFETVETSEEELETAVLEAMERVSLLNGMRGFYLDKQFNIIGTTGWDMLLYQVGATDKLFIF